MKSELVSYTYEKDERIQQIYNKDDEKVHSTISSEDKESSMMKPVVNRKENKVMGRRTHGAAPQFLKYRRERCNVSRKMIESVNRGRIQSAAGTMGLIRYQPGAELVINLNSPKRGLSPYRIHPSAETQRHPNPEVHLRRLCLPTAPGGSCKAEAS